MQLHYAIHKSLDVTAEEVDKAINECREVPGTKTEMYADGWIIVEPEDMHMEPWTRNTKDYNIETLYDDAPVETIDEICLIKDSDLSDF